MKKTIKGDSIVIKVEEDLIAANVKEFNNTFSEMINEGEEYRALILDLDKITNIDSVGVTFVVSLYKSADNEGRQFKVININKDIIQLFKLMKLDEFFEMEE